MHAEAIREQVRKIIGSRALIRSERLARFLEFTVGKTLAGDAGQLKEFVIGVEVFDRSQDYDPRLDPIVRVEARRLRMKLKKYYETEGRDDTLRIEYPKGGYAPAIRIERSRQEPARPAQTRIAVLPFSHSGSEECEFFTDGLTEELINALTKVDGLNVVAWNSSLTLKDSPRDYQKIGERLKVNMVLEGSVRQPDPGKIRISVQLVSVRDGSYHWTQTYERAREEAFSVRDTIAQAVARALNVPFDPPRVQTHNTEAHVYYLRGRYHWNKRRDEEVALGASYLEKAIAADPDYALAYAGLADCHVVLAKFGVEPPSKAMPKARRAAERALAIDPDLAEPHVALGSIAALFDWNWTEAERHMLRALELNPGYATAHQWYAHDVLPAMGRLEEAEEALARARDCDPLSVVISASAAENLMMQRRPQEALEAWRGTLELDPYFPRAHFAVARALQMLGRHGDAIAAMQRGLALIPQSPLAHALAANTYALAGQIGQARWYLGKLEEIARKVRVAPYLFMRAWMALDAGRGCDFLELACEDRDPRLVHAGASPVYDALRGQPRFEAMLRRMGLAVETVSA